MAPARRLHRPCKTVAAKQCGLASRAYARRPRPGRPTKKPKMEVLDAPATELPADVVPLVPMRNVVLFPHVLAPVTVGRARSLAALKHAAAHRSPIAVVLQKDAGVDEPGPEALCTVGTLAQVVQQLRSGDNQVHAVCQGLQRIRLVEIVGGHPFLAARIERLHEAPASTAAEALALRLRHSGQEVLQLMPGVPAELVQLLQTTRSASHLADLAASLVDAEPAEKQRLLETLDVEQRLQRVLQMVEHRLEVLRLSREIGARTKEQLDDRQRRVLLEEQMRAIRKELGEEGESAQELARLAEAISLAQMPPEAEAQAKKELQRLQRMGEASGEHSMLRTWL